MRRSVQYIPWSPNTYLVPLRTCPCLSASLLLEAENNPCKFEPFRVALQTREQRAGEYFWLQRRSEPFKPFSKIFTFETTSNSRLDYWRIRSGRDFGAFASTAVPPLSHAL